MTEAFQGTCWIADNTQSAKQNFGYIRFYDNMASYHRTQLQHNSFNVCPACYEEDFHSDILEMERMLRPNAEPLGSIDNLYYGYKEKKRLGMTYHYPDPTIYNNGVE